MSDEMETVTITKEEYKKLHTAYYKLLVLESFGVTHWEGYEDAVQALDEARERIGD